MFKFHCLDEALVPFHSEIFIIAMFQIGIIRIKYCGMARGLAVYLSSITS